MAKSTREDFPYTLSDVYRKKLRLLSAFHRVSGMQKTIDACIDESYKAHYAQILLDVQELAERTDTK